MSDSFRINRHECADERFHCIKAGKRCRSVFRRLDLMRRYQSCGVHHAQGPQLVPHSSHASSIWSRYWRPRSAVEPDGSPQTPDRLARGRVPVAEKKKAETMAGVGSTGNAGYSRIACSSFTSDAFTAITA